MEIDVLEGDGSDGSDDRCAALVRPRSLVVDHTHVWQRA